MMKRPRRGTGSGSSYSKYGDPVEQLGPFGQSVDLLVLGSHSHGPIGHLGTGISQRLADAPPCPLLVVPQLRAHVKQMM